MSIVKRTQDNWIPAVFDDMFKTDWFGNAPSVNRIGTSIPAVNIKESDNGFEVEVAAPGKAREDFKIELNKDVLTISAEKPSENVSKDEDGKFTRREFSYSTFKRAFGLPETVDTEKIAANYKDGVLVISLPKREEAKMPAKRTIEIA